MDFEFTGGTHIGREHLGVKNNQDAFAIRTSPSEGMTAIVIADGCSSGDHSEYGARWAAGFLANFLLARAYVVGGRPNFLLDDFWETCRNYLLLMIEDRCNEIGRADDFKHTLNQSFLFTLNGLLLSRDWAVFFNIGDGVRVINGEIHNLGPFPNNAPPYVGLGLLNPSKVTVPQDLLRFQTSVIPTHSLFHFLVGSDGVNEIVKHADKVLRPTNEPVGPLSQFWTTDKFFKRPVWTTLRLNVLGRDYDAIDFENKEIHHEDGILFDDTTLVAGRRLWRKE